jgi:hypothetical protein
MNLTHIVGLFSYALVLGVVVEDVTATVQSFKRGNTAICDHGHTVILNKNRHTGPLQVRSMPGTVEEICLLCRPGSSRSMWHVRP